MPRQKAIADGLTKAQRHRKTQHHRGMKLLRVWVPDPHRPEFVAEAARQAKLLRGRPEEAEALIFIDAAPPRQMQRSRWIAGSKRHDRA